MGNRKLPFGYQMRFGDVIPHSDEAEAVQKIYQNYLAGASFRQIAEGLQAQGIPYDGDKQWNKNMVARILENERYTGSGPFPALIPAELFRSVSPRRRKSSSTGKVFSLLRTWYATFRENTTISAERLESCRRTKSPALL